MIRLIILNDILTNKFDIYTMDLIPFTTPGFIFRAQDKLYTVQYYIQTIDGYNGTVQCTK